MIELGNLASQATRLINGAGTDNLDSDSFEVDEIQNLEDGSGLEIIIYYRGRSHALQVSNKEPHGNDDQIFLNYLVAKFKEFKAEIDQSVI